MALNPTGPISMGGTVVGESINLELGKAATATISLNDADARALAGISTGTISLSNFYGKSNSLGHYIVYSAFTKGTVQSDDPYAGLTWNGKTYHFWTGTTYNTNRNGFTAWIYNSTFTTVTPVIYRESAFNDFGTVVARDFLDAPADGNGIFVYNNNIYASGYYQLQSFGTSTETVGAVMARFDENLNLLSSSCIAYLYTSGTSVNSFMYGFGVRNGNIFASVATSVGNTTQTKGNWELNPTTFAKISIVTPQKGATSPSTATRRYYTPTPNGGVWMSVGTNNTSTPANNGIVFEYINSAGTSTGVSSSIAGFILNYASNPPIPDNNGNLIFTAYRNAAAPTTSWILAKRLTNNTLAWSKTINSAGGNNRNNSYFYPRSDENGNIYVLWRNAATFDFYLGAVNQPLLLKFDANGNFIFCKRIIIGATFTIAFVSPYWINDSNVNGTPIITDGINLGFYVSEGNAATNAALVNIRMPLDGNCNGTYTVNGRTVTIQDQAVTVGNHTWGAGVAITLADQGENYLTQTVSIVERAAFPNAISNGKVDI